MIVVVVALAVLKGVVFGPSVFEPSAMDLPHHYVTTATTETEGPVNLTSPGVPDLPSMPPKEFGGPGDQWSPETLLTAAIADCYVLSFRAIARASKLEWRHLECNVEGTLDKADGVTKFVRFDITSVLTAPAGVDEAKATRILERAEKVCLISNSLSAEIHLNTSLKTEG